MQDWLIIDGSNLLHQLAAGERGIDMNRLRRNLLARLESLIDVIARRITIVFDGSGKDQSGHQAESKIIEVVFTPSNRTADSVIENLVWNAPQPENILVVTSDRLERDAASARGADTMASSFFITLLKDQTDNLRARIQRINKNNESITLADFFPKA